MFFYIVLTPISTTLVYEVPAIRVNTTKSTYTFTSVKCGEYPVKVESLNVDALEQEFSKFVPRNQTCHLNLNFKGTSIIET